MLRDMREAFQDAEPEEIRELVSSLVGKIELHYDHERHGKLERNPFKHGTIFVRPIEPQLSILLGNSASSTTTCSSMQDLSTCSRYLEGTTRSATIIL